MNDKQIKSALISVFYKDGLDEIAKELHAQGVTIYSTGGTQTYLENLNIPCVAVESVTGYPSILGGRVKTLHPSVFGGILGRRYVESDLQEMDEYKIPQIDLVIVDLYPFEETLATTSEEAAIIEKIDIGGPSMIRAAAKNFRDLVVLADKKDYTELLDLLKTQKGLTTIDQRKSFSAKAFEVVMNYDIAINNYFNGEVFRPLRNARSLRYGENPHQDSGYFGDLSELFEQLNGKELSYNNLVDVDAALQLIAEFDATTFAIFKHTNVCGVAQRSTVKASWDAALAGDPESAFGGVLITNGKVDLATAEAINEIFFEVLIAPSYDADALSILKSKKNRIILEQKQNLKPGMQYRSILNGTLIQHNDVGNFQEWKEVGARPSSEAERGDLEFANLVCKHLKSNAIALIKDKQLVGKGCGQTSRIDALRHAVEKAKQFNFDLSGAVMASDAFFPFDDCVKLGHEAGIVAFIQPGGSIRDQDSIDYCTANDLVMVITGQRHFRH
ncbi:MAG: bifunctional phosphoribosylaminoimidazolecarboxamide formyltransferase/IMP cyclohydrolase [Bacteroidota bacterium]|nr:bifunctional phosphoribosylaminoimidazolecarboxamide formyltransferase/IMP cyclohydrolase [Bacteroidota bacterium]MDX5429550.1 bifunctional phosphoribosylaminoimidazolecarboxamide formyltransferase/IMP cyclohydrolase [Bacteroidota bacterium]MDX5468337.1 bifunctional phosphoribosylaminoimidazolecarboxamide formyltransferase/IMP cyclohydrolase [Bacteroidota bacterium]